MEFSRLGLVIIDEQHRFGVEQRRQLLTAFIGGSQNDLSGRTDDDLLATYPVAIGFNGAAPKRMRGGQTQ